MMSVVPRAVQFVSIHFIAALTFPALASTRPSLEKYVCRLSNAQMLNLSFGPRSFSPARSAAFAPSMILPRMLPERSSRNTTDRGNGFTTEGLGGEMATANACLWSLFSGGGGCCTPAAATSPPHTGICSTKSPFRQFCFWTGSSWTCVTPDPICTSESGCVEDCTGTWPGYALRTVVITESTCGRETLGSTEPSGRVVGALKTYAPSMKSRGWK